MRQPGARLTPTRTYVRDQRRQRVARFRRALETGNELLGLGAARELPQIALDDALRNCLVLREGDRRRYDRAAVRWLGRFALEARAVTIADLRAAAAALDALPAVSPERSPSISPAVRRESHALLIGRLGRVWLNKAG